MDVIGSVTGAINAALKLKELADKLKNVEMMGAIVDLQSKLVDVKMECVTFRDENLQLKAEIKRLSEPPEVYTKNGFYYKRDGDDGPYCTACLDTKQQLVRVAASPGSDQNRGIWYRCPGCQAPFTGRAVELGAK